MRTRIALAVVAGAAAALPVAGASAAYCEIQVGQKCVVQSVCATATAPVHTVDDALGRPLGGFPHCVD